jgi:ABC-type branched-subunit amino acid transport system permease subunit
MPLIRIFIGAAILAAIGASAPVIPLWMISLFTVAMSTGLVVAGLIVLWRAGLVPFGQALFFATGAYTVALAGRWFGINDAFALVAMAAVAAALVAVLVGFLLARYREIFFAMLSLALSMILYGILVKSEALGSTDGINVAQASFLGLKPRGPAYTLALFWLALGMVFVAWLAVSAYLGSVAGQLAGAIRDNEIRVEYLGISVTRLVHLKLTIAAALAGAGGALAALSISHVDPQMAYWTTSGGFVFVTILAGAASVPAAFVGALLFEIVRSFAVAMLPGGWQMILGSVLLLTILFVPDGLGSLVMRKRPAVQGGAA